MGIKISGYYQDQDTTQPNPEDQLVLAVSHDEFACLTGIPGKLIDGFELFHLPANEQGWNGSFHALSGNSQLLGRNYRNTHCWFNMSEAVLVPAERFTMVAAEDYLNLLYGENDQYELRHEDTGRGIVVAYRIHKQLHEMLTRLAVLYQPHHIYTSVLKELLDHRDKAGELLLVQIYHSHLIAFVMKNQQLQLAQCFRYQTQEDILYHLVNLSEQFSFDKTQSHLSISGSFEQGAVLHQQLQSLFGLIGLDTADTSGIFQTVTDQPVHYFTPYQKLML